MLYKWKSRFQKIAVFFSTKGLTANLATLIGVLCVVATVLSIVIGIQRHKGFFLLAVVFIFIRFVMNALDGMLARQQGTASALGEVMNEVFDVVGDSLSYGIFYFFADGLQSSVFLFVIAIWFAEFAGVLGKSLPNGKRRQESLGGGKPERALLLSIMFIVLYIDYSFFKFLDVVFYTLSVLTFLTGLQRVRASVRAAGNAPYFSDPQGGV